MIALTERDDLREREHLLHADERDVTKRITRLVDLLSSGIGDVPSLVSKLRELERRKVEMETS